MIQNELNSSYENFQFDDIIFDDDPFWNNNEDQPNMFDKELNKFLKLEDGHSHTLGSKYDSDT